MSTCITCPVLLCFSLYFSLSPVFYLHFNGALGLCFISITIFVIFFTFFIVIIFGNFIFSCSLPSSNVEVSAAYLYLLLSGPFLNYFLLCIGILCRLFFNVSIILVSFGLGVIIAPILDPVQLDNAEPPSN